MNPISVTHVTLALDSGGLERVVLSLVAEGRRLGQTVSVVCLERPGTLAPLAEQAGATVYSVNKKPGLRLGTTKVLRRLFASIRPDAVHTHQIGALFYAGRAARQAGVRAIVHTEHGKHYDAARLRTRLLARVAARSAQRFCCVSADIAAAVVARRIASASKVCVVPNGIDTARYAHGDPAETTRLRESLGIPAGAPVIGTVGNLREVKRQDVLIRGFARLGPVEGGLPPHLVIVGDGELKAELAKLAADLGVGGRVHLVGHQPAPERFLHLVDVFALTSRSEGMPLAVLEAWAAGRPVVASRVGGLPELIEDGRTGMLFESGRDGELAGILADLLRNPARAGALGDAGRSRASGQFDLSVMARTYDRLYLELSGAFPATQPEAGRPDEMLSGT